MSYCNNTTPDYDANICKEFKDEEDKWNHSGQAVYAFYQHVALWADCIILVVSMIVLFRVVFIFKRRDWFLILTPTFFMLHGALGIPFDYFILHRDDKTAEIRKILEVLAPFLYLMGHWTFSA